MVTRQFFFPAVPLRIGGEGFTRVFGASSGPGRTGWRVGERVTKNVFTMKIRRFIRTHADSRWLVRVIASLPRRTCKCTFHGFLWTSCGASAHGFLRTSRGAGSGSGGACLFIFVHKSPKFGRKVGHIAATLQRHITAILQQVR